MVFTKALREAIVEVDARWRFKFCLRIAQNVVCILSIICAVFTLAHNSNFVPKAFAQAKLVMIYLPCVRIFQVVSRSNLTPSAGCAHDSLEYRKYCITCEKKTSNQVVSQCRGPFPPWGCLYNYWNLLHYGNTQCFPSSWNRSIWGSGFRGA
jgi:hypothetical protein